MAIFRRRIVQRELNLLRPKVIRPEQGQDLVGRLNSSRPQALAAEWEVVLLGSVSRLASVQYERQFDSERLDIFARNHKGFEFVGDIVAISDTENEKRNPAEFFFQEVMRLASRAGLTRWGLDIRIADCTVGKYPDKQTKLLLPPKGEIPQFLTRELMPFLRIARSQPSNSHVFHFKQPGIDFVITYDPKLAGSITGGHALPGAPLSLKRNPLFAALDAKATKLRRSSYAGVKGIIVVDGGCQALSSQGGDGSQWSRDSIVETFLRGHPAIDFVTTTTFMTTSGWSKTEYRFSNKIYWKRPFDEKLIDWLYPLLNETFKRLPTPVESPSNAWRNVRSRRQISRGCRLGIYRWTPTQELAISSRTFVALISGTLTDRDFRILFDRTNPLQGRALLLFFGGLAQFPSMLRSVRVEYCMDEDDDLIVFTARSNAEVQVASTLNTYELPLAVLVRYIVGLDHEMLGGHPNRSTLATIPSDVQQGFCRMVDEGRMLVAAQLTENGETVRLSFGDYDAATSDYV